MNVGALDSRVISTEGVLTLSGSLDVAGTTASTLAIFGGINTTGALGSYRLTGPITGTGTIEKAGAGTMFLTPSATSGFSGSIRVGGSATGGGAGSGRSTSMGAV